MAKPDRLDKLEAKLAAKDIVIKEKDTIIKENKRVIKILKLKLVPLSLGFYRSRFR